MTDPKPEHEFGDLRIAWLEAFVLTVENEKRAAAAAQMEVSDDTVSKHITKLEKWLGSGPRRLLLWPNTYPPTLTGEGERFLPSARQILELARAARAPAVVPIRTPVSPGALRVPPAVVPVGDSDGTTTDGE